MGLLPERVEYGSSGARKKRSRGTNGQGSGHSASVPATGGALRLPEHRLMSADAVLSRFPLFPTRWVFWAGVRREG
jgi:hypothetical protein